MNSIVQIYRQQFPEDQRSDDDITMSLAAENPQVFFQVPDAVSDYQRIHRDLSSQARTIGDYVKQPVGALIRGATDTLAQLPEAVHVGAEALQRKVPLPGVEFNSDFPFVHYVTPSEQSKKYEDELAGKESDSLVSKAGAAIKSAGEDIAPENQEGLEDSFLATKVPNTVGGLGAFLLAGGPAKGLVQAGISSAARATFEDVLAKELAGGTERALADKLANEAASKTYEQVSKSLLTKAAGTVPEAGLGAGVFGAQGYKQAIAEGHPEKAYEAALLNAGIGATMALPLGRMFKRLDEAGTGFTGKLLESGKDSLTTGLTMAAQTAAQRYVDNKLYDKDDSLLTDLASDASAGGIAGGLFSLLMQSIGKHAASLPKSEEKPEQLGVSALKNYETNPRDVEKVSNVMERLNDGEKGPAIEAALAEVKADPQLSALMEQAQQPEPQTPAEKIADKIEEAQQNFNPPKEEAASEEPAQAPQVELAQQPIPANSKPEENVLVAARRAGAKTDVTETEAPTAIPALQEKLNAARRLATSANEEQPELRFSDRANVKAWSQLTPDEFLSSVWTGHKIIGRKLHQFSVEQAIEQGIKVPSKVLDSYPGIAQAVAKKVQRRQDREEFEAGQRAYRERKRAAALQAPAPDSINTIVQPAESGAQPAGNRTSIVQAPAPTTVTVPAEPSELLDRVAFDTARVVSGQSGVGKKSAPAFIETNSPDELYKDSTATANDRSKSRKLGVFSSPDGSRVVVGTAYRNGGQSYVTGLDAHSHPVAFRYNDLAARGYRLIAAIKTAEPTKRYAVTYSANEWNNIASQMRERVNAAKATAEAVADHLEDAKTYNLGEGAIEQHGGTAMRRTRPRKSWISMRDTLKRFSML
jgi:hypothetical protein